MWTVSKLILAFGNFDKNFQNFLGDFVREIWNSCKSLFKSELNKYKALTSSEAAYPANADLDLNQSMCFLNNYVENRPVQSTFVTEDDCGKLRVNIF